MDADLTHMNNIEKTTWQKLKTNTGEEDDDEPKVALDLSFWDKKKIKLELFIPTSWLDLLIYENRKMRDAKKVAKE